MKSIRNLAELPASIPVVADDVLEFHAARLLMLLKICGTGGRIDGLTKMAKLDFFVRYPPFFDKICESLGVGIESPISSVESSMVRFHYGPWDKRYYQVLGYLESKHIISISKQGNAYHIALTNDGKGIAKHLAADPAFSGLSEQMKRVKQVLGGKAGSTLKNMIYKVFDEEIANRSLGEVIR
jgi:hypothetical protein